MFHLRHSKESNSGIWVIRVTLVRRVGVARVTRFIFNRVARGLRRRKLNFRHRQKLHARISLGAYLPPGLAHQAQPMLKPLIPRARHERKHMYSVLSADSMGNGTGHGMFRDGTCPRGQSPEVPFCCVGYR